MKTPIDYVNDLKAKFGSDYEATKQLKLGKSTLAMIRKRNQMSDETALNIAAALQIPADEILINAAIARAEGEAKTAWIAHAKKVGIAASFAFAAVMTPGQTRIPTLTATFTGDQNCILCKITWSYQQASW